MCVGGSTQNSKHKRQERVEGETGQEGARNQKKAKPNHAPTVDTHLRKQRWRVVEEQHVGHRGLGQDALGRGQHDDIAEVVEHSVHKHNELQWFSCRQGVHGANTP